MDPIDYIKAEMERRGWRNRDLVPAFGSSGRVSEVLGRKRWLTIGMISALHFNFGLDASALLRPYELARPKKVGHKA